jgi:hypothetical protein
MEKTLTSRLLNETREIFDKYIKEESGIFVEDELLGMMRIAWQEKISPAKPIKRILKKSRCRNREEINLLVAAASNLWNSLLDFFEASANMNDKQLTRRLKEIYVSMEKSRGEEMRDIVKNEMLGAYQDFQKIYRVRPITKDYEADLNYFISRFDHYFTQPFSKLLITVAYFPFIEDQMAGREGDEIFDTYFRFVYGLEKIRKIRYHVRQLQGRKGKNEPCPCGSGLKYKNCCMI